MTDQKTDTQAPKTDAPKAVVAAASAPAEATAQIAAQAPAAAAKAATTVVKAARVKARKPRAVKAKTARKARKTPARAAAKVAKARKAAVRTVRTSIKTSEQTIKKGTRTMTNEANKVAERVQAVFGEANERAKTAIERNTRIAEEMTDLAKGNVEALVASTKVAAKGVEKIGQEVAEYNRKSFEGASAAIKSFAEVKSPTDLFRLQGEFARTQFDSMIAESSKLSETMIKLAGDVFEPITGRYSVAAERVKNAVAI